MQPAKPQSGDRGKRPEFMFIKGITQSGKKFRPSDWADRLYGAVATYASEADQNKKLIADCVCLIERNRIKGVLVDSRLRELEPQLFRFVHGFAADNDLSVEMLDPLLWHYEHRRIVERPRRTFY